MKNIFGKIAIDRDREEKGKGRFFNLLNCNEDLNSTFCRFISVRFVSD